MYTLLYYNRIRLINYIC